MNISFLTQYIVLVIVGICLCIGFILKNIIKTKKINNYIPLIVGALGVGIAFWIYREMTAEVLLKGLFSGLASTGLYEAFRNLINNISTKKKG